MEKKLHDISYYWIVAYIVILGVCILAFLVPYMYCFSGGVSTEHTRWAEFGNYIAGIAGLLNIIAFVGLTIVIHITEKERGERSLRFRAEELVIKKLQVQQDKFNELYIKFRETKSKDFAHDAFELIQPMMIYFYYLKGLNFLTNSTKKSIEEVHQYFFKASDILYSYAEDIDFAENKSKEIAIVIKTYNEILRRLGELEVTMIADVTKMSDYGVEITADKEPEKKNINN